ncbi:WD40-repeat-containing domain protein [Cadophora sp. MPI-SDFR-AT-0126]|nr:WD40-repeat-containing domain protein [Leotiomycetes sp. MPI-SDFR-AT-0126]
MSSKDDKREWELPHLREAHQMMALDNVSADFFDVKFYPYTEPGVDPVFAVVGGKRIMVCRPSGGKDHAKINVIQEILDEEKETDHYACAWSKDAETGTPLLCVAGGSDQVKVFNVVTGDLLMTFPGHGGEINDLAVSPINPYIIASASEDCTVRIWSLDPRHANQPCAAILEGDGHKETVLCLAFHPSGRYLLSGGIDHRINLWTLPEFPDANTGTNIPTRIYYPHFSTSEIHGDIVDCVSWFGDLILSKAANEHNIVLWSITNFDSSSPPPSSSLAPTSHDASRDARSSFVSPPVSAADNAISLYTRHLQLSIPESHIMFTRFSLFPGCKTGPGRHPVIAFCNTNSKVFFWDFERFENYYDTQGSMPGADGLIAPEYRGDSPSKGEKGLNTPTDNTLRAHPFLHPFQRRNRGGGNVGGVGAIARLARETSLSESTGSEHTNQDETSQGQAQSSTNTNAGKGKIDWARSREGWKARYELGDPMTEMEPHHTEMVKGLKFTGRQVAWSNDGEWCVVAGSSGSIGVLGRWGR